MTEPESPLFRLEEETQRLRPAIAKVEGQPRSRREIISKLKAMNQDKKRSYLEETVREVENIFFQNMEDVDKIRVKVIEMIPGKLKESFKNGLELGKRQGTGQDRQNKKPYRKFRR